MTKRVRRSRSTWLTTAPVLLALLVPSAATAATISVSPAALDSANSGTDGDTLCSPREAVISANQNSLTFPVNVSDCTTAGTGADTVSVPSGIFNLTLPGEVHSAADPLGGDLDLTDQTAIQGVNPSSTTIFQTVAGQRVIHVPSGSPTGTVLSQISITGGSLTPNGNVTSFGGGVFFNGGTPDMRDVRVFDNTIVTSGAGFPNGGGIAVSASGAGSVELTDVSAINNDLTSDFGDAQGGGIWIAGGGTANALTRVRLADNDISSPLRSASGGGAFLNSGTIVNGAVVDNNTATVTTASQEFPAGAYGAGIFGDGGGIDVSDATITNNDAIGAGDASGGGIFMSFANSNSDFTNLTIADNTASAGDEALGGGFGARTTAGEFVDLSFVTFSGNSATGPTSPDAVAAVGPDTVIRFRATAIDSAAASGVCGTGDGLGGGNLADTSGGTFTSAGANAGVGTSCGLTGANDIQSLAPGAFGLGALADNTGGAAAYQAGASGFKAPIQTREPTSTSVLLERAAACSTGDGNPVLTDASGGSRPQGPNCDAGAHERLNRPAPAEPTLTDTDPDSPAPEDHPRIKGTAPAGSTVTLYRNSACSSQTAAGTGSAAQFASPGILVTVPRDSTTTFHAIATDAAGNSSACSASSITYVEALLAPTFTDTDPDSPADDRSPFVKGTAPEGDGSLTDVTVTLYTTPNCSDQQGFGVARGRGDEFASPGIRILVEDNSTTTFYAKVTIGNRTSACSTSSITYVNTTMAAPTLTDTDPDSPADERFPFVKGSAPEGSTVRLYTTSDCTDSPGRVGSAGVGSAAEFASPGIRVGVADDSTTTFRATATDAAGNSSACSSSSITYVEDSTPPGRPRISIADVTREEGNSDTTRFGFRINLSSPAPRGGVTVDYETVNGSATRNDYIAESGEVRFARGESQKRRNIEVRGDTAFEPNETFFVRLSRASRATIADRIGKLTIENGDAEPIEISVGSGGSQPEGSPGVRVPPVFSFAVRLSRPAPAGGVSVRVKTIDGSARSAIECDSCPAAGGPDYNGRSTLLNFAQGREEKFITVSAIRDHRFEPNENFRLRLRAGTAEGATISVDDEGSATIENDDAPPPEISINDVSLAEGNPGATSANLMGFTISLSAPAPAGGVGVAFVTKDRSAQSVTASRDYVDKSGDVFFSPGESEKRLPIIQVFGDSRVEPDEFFEVHLQNLTGGTFASADARVGTGTIRDDEPTISIDDVTQAEGNSGDSPFTEFTFTVSLSAPPPANSTVPENGAIEVEAVTEDGSATGGGFTSPDDYVGGTAEILFRQGRSQFQVRVRVRGDTFFENEEFFEVHLRNASGGRIADGGEGVGIGTIQNDDRRGIGG